MEKAWEVSKDSHDAETKVGAILINKRTGSPVAEGYNGFVRGAPDDKLPNTRPDKYPLILHAEQNLLMNIIANNMNVDTSDCFLVCTLSPCSLCMRLLFQAQIKTIVFQDTYRDFEDQCKMEDIRVDINKVGKYNIINLEAK
jgi:deoxycytidylate deaminase